MTTTKTNGNGNGNESPLVQSFKAARRVSTPLIAVETPDAAATIITLLKAMPPTTPLLSWDIAKGLRGINSPGESALYGLGLPMPEPNNPLPQPVLVNPTEALMTIETLPKESVVFFHNLHLQLVEPSGTPNTPVVQALWNLRDVFKANHRMVVGLGPAFILPAELAGDVIVLAEPLPTRVELGAILDEQYRNVNEALTASGQPALALPDDTTRTAALDAVVGLASYTAEQVLAMGIGKSGISVPKLWERKIKTLANNGITVYKPMPHETSLDELKGLDNVVAYAKKLIATKSFNLVVFIDEMDKALAGGMAEHVGDSGVSKDQVGQVLTYINDTKSPSIMLAGVAGSGKSQLAKAIGAASGKPVVFFDLGGLKGGVVGESERKIRTFFKIITATAEGKVLFIGTANRTVIFTPEMNRRFPKQFYFDVLSAAGRKAVWPVYVTKNGLTPEQAAFPVGFDEGWTGAEIQRACEDAALFGETVVEAAQYLIPQSVSAKAVIEQMRRESAGKFLSASYAGFYQLPTEPVAKPKPGRSIDMN